MYLVAAAQEPLPLDYAQEVLTSSAVPRTNVPHPTEVVPACKLLPVAVLLILVIKIRSAFPLISLNISI